MSKSALLVRSCLIPVLVGTLAACTGAGTPSSTCSTAASTVPATTASTTPPTSTSSLPPSSTTEPPVVTSTSAAVIGPTVDLVAYQAANGPGWFSESLEDLPEAFLLPEGVFEVLCRPRAEPEEWRDLAHARLELRLPPVR